MFRVATLALCARDCSDLAVKLADGAADSAALGGDGGIGAGCFAIEGKNAVAEILVQQALDGLGECVTPATCRQDRHAMAPFSFADSREIGGCSILSGQPSLNLRRWLRPQQPEKHVAAKDNHPCFPGKYGGSRIGSRGGRSSSTPSNAATRERLAAARLRAAAGLVTTSWRISRASSSSFDRPSSRPSMLDRADAQAALEAVFKVADRDAGHGAPPHPRKWQA